MRGVFYTGDRTVAVRSKPDPRPGDGEVLVRMRAAAVCGSDLHRYRLPTEKLTRFADTVAGHEPSGVVAEVGAGVSQVKPGDRVVVYHRRGCGHCADCARGEIGYCRQARSHGAHCDGGDGDYLVTDERNCLPLPDDLSFGVGALLACNFGTAFCANRRLAPTGGNNLVVFGLGPVGLCSVMVSKAMGARVIGVDVSPGRLELAHSLGADAVVDGSVGDTVAAIRQLTDDRGADRAIETSGSTAAQLTLVRSLARSGEASIVGFGHGTPSVHLSEIIDRQLVLRGSSIFGLGDHYAMLEFIRRTRLPIEQVITHRFSIEDGAEAFRVADSAGSGKVVFEWPE
ncbi:MAG TPA: alcohol dehydrogenase catalytic domain-containing protein [Chloroflexota bacterium]|nr:alcohol dehydrogenase catalytic domain-containing protein [Chloroflexota bacterium]